MARSVAVFVLVLALLAHSVTATCKKYNPGTIPTYTAPECQSKMFAKYGLDGFEAVNTFIVEKAFRKAQAPKLGKAFLNLAKQGTRPYRTFVHSLANFLVEAFGGPYVYKGQSMKVAHAGLKITSQQYDHFVTKLIVPALIKAGVDSTDIEECFAPQVTALAFKSLIVECE